MFVLNEITLSIIKYRCSETRNFHPYSLNSTNICISKYNVYKMFASCCYSDNECKILTIFDAGMTKLKGNILIFELKIYAVQCNSINTAIIFVKHFNLSTL